MTLSRLLPGLALMGCLAALFARLYLTHSFVAGDSALNYMNLRSLVKDRDLDFRNEYDFFYRQRSPYTGNRKILEVPDDDPVTHRKPNGKPLGTAVALLPFFLFADALRYVVPFQTDDGYGWQYQLSAALGSLLYGLLAVWLMYRLGRRYFSAEVALLGALATWLATPLVYYMTVEPLMGHSISAFFVTAFIFIWASSLQERTLRQWIALGLLGGFAGFLHYQDGVFLGLPIVETIWRRKKTTPLIPFVLAATPCLAIQALANTYLYGHPLSAGYYGSLDFHFLSTGLLHTLFDFPSGAFSMCPILAVSAWGLFTWRKREPLAGGALAGMCLLEWYAIGGLYPSIVQGASFGNRMLVSCSCIFALGLMQNLSALESRRRFRWAVAGCAALVAANGLLIGLYCLRVVRDPYVAISASSTRKSSIP